MNIEGSANFPNPDFVERFRARYPLLAMLIEEKGMGHESFFSMRQTGRLFEVNTRTLQRTIKEEELKVRGIGRGRLHAEDLERLLRNGQLRRRKNGGDRSGGKGGDI